MLPVEMLFMKKLFIQANSLFRQRSMVHFHHKKECQHLATLQNKAHSFEKGFPTSFLKCWEIDLLVETTTSNVSDFM